VDTWQRDHRVQGQPGAERGPAGRASPRWGGGAAMGQWVDGMRDGTWTRWSPAGAFVDRTDLEARVRHGLHQRIAIDGRVLQLEFDNDVLTGLRGLPRSRRTERYAYPVCRPPSASRCIRINSMTFGAHSGHSMSSKSTPHRALGAGGRTPNTHGATPTRWCFASPLPMLTSASSAWCWQTLASSRTFSCRRFAECMQQKMRAAGVWGARVLPACLPRVPEHHWGPKSMEQGPGGV